MGCEKECLIENTIDEEKNASIERCKNDDERKELHNTYGEKKIIKKNIVKESNEELILEGRKKLQNDFDGNLNVLEVDEKRGSSRENGIKNKWNEIIWDKIGMGE